MPADRDPPTLADYAVTAVSPGLVMLMVGSLVFFLVEVLYAGQYSGRLLYTLFFFVFGAVLVARIAIQYDATRASLYGAGLGLVTFLAIMAYVDYPPGTPLRSVSWLVNLGLMGVVWWSAHKLTKDCTHIDETRDASGRGLVSALASESVSASVREDERREIAGAKGRGKKGGKRRKNGPLPFSAWVGRWREYREKRRDRPHTPGVWVVYFSLAALPLFALGQSLIPADDAGRRRTTFLLTAVYVGSGLGLLVTTSLLGLRRYLRQRKATAPAVLTAGWLRLGAALIAAFLLVAAVLPRPHSEVPWFGLPRAGKAEREASRYAQLGDAAGKGDGAEGEVTEKGAGSASGKNGEPGGSRGGKGGGKGKGKSSGGKDKSGQQGSDSDDRKGDSSDADGPDRGPTGDTDREGREAGEKSSGRRTGSASRPPDTKLGEVATKVAGVVKWLAVAAVVFLVLAAAAVFVLRYLAPFTAWAQNLLDSLRNWWAGLFGRKGGRAAAAEETAEPTGPRRPPPFSAFSNPFADGTAAGRDVGQLVEYTFAALDAWAWDRGHGWADAETPLEFAARLGAAVPAVAATADRLAALYARVAYSDLPVPADTAAFLEQAWEHLVYG